MSGFDQVPFSTAEFADNPEPRCPCLLLLDNSMSMRGSPIDQLNEGLRIFREELASDTLASKRVEVGIVTFGPVHVETDFISAQNFHAPVLSVAGDTPWDKRSRRASICSGFARTPTNRTEFPITVPGFFLITDGGPTDSWTRAAQLGARGRAVEGFQLLRGRPGRCEYGYPSPDLGEAFEAEGAAVPGVVCLALIFARFSVKISGG
jgi:hypothetical protein